jgi:predicted RND superfamily exporter protein
MVTGVLGLAARQIREWHFGVYLALYVGFVVAVTGGPLLLAGIPEQTVGLVVAGLGLATTALLIGGSGW